VKWPWSKQEAPSATTLGIADPALAAVFNPMGLVDLAGASVNEHSALGLSALFRGVSLVSGTLAGLPLRSYRTDDAGRPEVVASVFDDPDGPYRQTVFEWKESLFAHLVIHGRAGALKVRNEAGGLVNLPLVHPLSFYPELPTIAEYQTGELPVGGLWFRVSLNDGTQVRLDATDFWYVPGISLDGRHGMSILTYAQTSLGTAIAGDKSAARMFSQGAMISGMISPTDEDLEGEDVKEIRRTLDNSVQGHENAGKIAILSRKLGFTPWTMSAVDAQFLQSRQFSIEEIARWTGVPPHLLMQTDKQTSWGTGVDEQNRGLAKFVLGHWAQRFEQRASRLLAKPRWCEFEFAGLERPNFATEVDLLIKQVAAGILTIDEARAIRNLPPLPKQPPTPAPNPNPTEGDNANAS
jgi:HK97 family phage portal protein